MTRRGCGLRAATSGGTAVAIAFCLVGWAAQRPLLLTYVSVLTDQGQAVRGLQPEDFAVNVNGQAQSVQYVHPATDALDVVIEGEASGDSVTGRLHIREAIDSLVAEIRRRGSAARIAFASDTTVPRPIDVVAGAKAIAAAASGFVPDPAAEHLLQNIVEGTKVLERSLGSRRVVLVLAVHQGRDSLFTVPATVLSALRESGAALWAIEAIPSHAGQGMTLSADLEAFSRYSGGEHLEIVSDSDLPRIGKQVVDAILSQYVVAVALSEESRPGSLNITLTRKGKFRVFAPQWTPPR